MRLLSEQERLSLEEEIAFLGSELIIFEEKTLTFTENFNLKLRIYFLEERMQQKFDGPIEDIYKINIELKVEVESLKRDLQEREKLLIKASKAVESLAQGGDAEIQRVKEEAHKKVQQVEEILTSRINLLEENLKAAQEEVEKAFAMTEREKVLRMAVEQKLSGVTNTHLKELDSITELPEKDRLIEQLTLSLKSKEAMIQHLEEEKSQSESCDGNLPAEKIRELTVALRHEKDSEIEAIKMEVRNERNCFEKKIRSLQEELRERENELSVEKKNGLKRDKTIQGLTLALKTKEKENEELNSEIEDLNVSLAKAREATHKAQIQKFKGAEDYQALLMEKETLLAELRSENLTKDTENRKLQRRIKRTDQELNDLNLEREKMERELDEAQLQKSRGDKTINDLRNQLEKLHGEMIEREKAVEHHYNILLSESNQKLQSQELVIKRLTDSVNQKDLLLQVELQEVIKKCKNLLKAKEDLELMNEDLIKEKCASESQQSIIKIEKKESEYEELILVLRKEQHIYSTLVKTLKDSDSINSLQTELNNIFLLRKQLEEDILANRNLRKVLEDQIKDTKNREDETFSFCGDQTSYMSICLGEHDHLNLQIDHLSLEELKKKVAELILMVKDLHSVNQEQEQMKIVIALLDHLSTTEQDCSSEDIENKAEKDLRQMIIQLRAELRHFKQVNKILKQQVELKSTSDGKERLYPDTAPQVNKDIELLKVELKDTATQTMTIEGNVMRLKHEGKREASEEKTKYSRLNAEPQQENASKKGEQHERLSVTSRTNKKSRLPIPLKSSRSLGNIPLTSCTQKPDMHLQHRLLALDEGLKESKIQNKHLHKELSLSGSVIETAQAKPEEERVLVRETETPHNISDMNILHSLKELNKEFYSMDNQDTDSATTNSGSKSLLSLKLSVPSTDAFDDYEVIDDLEELRQRIKDMKSELEKYKMFIFHLQPTNPFLSSDIFNIVLNDAELPIERHVIQMQDTDGQETQTFSTVHQQVDYEIRIENLNSQSAETPDEQTSQNLKQLLLENEAELEREQIANMHLLDEVYRLQNKLRETSPSKYDSLVHSQARELSFQRQQIKEIHSICVTYHQHLTSLIKAFEELLQASDVDYYVAEGFREQLNQSVQLFEKLEKKFLYGMNNEKTTTMHQQLKDESPIPSAFHSLSDFEMSEKSSIGSPEPKQDLVEEEHDKLALVPSKFPPALLMEHLQEIRSLRQRLEDSIKTNERLRLQLERQVTDIELNQGSANIFIHGSEQRNSLTSEIHFLRKQNQVLNVMLTKGSRDKQKENEKLRESLSKKNAIIEHLHQDYECFKKENEKLQKQIGKKEDENRHLTHEIYSSRNELNRLQTEMNVKQHQLSENDKLLQSLRVELKVYEKLDEARRRRAEFQKDQNNPLDLHELLTEIQSLRVQLERSIETNKTLHEKLEEQLSKEKREEAASVSAVNINYLLKRDSQHYTRMNETQLAAKEDLDSSSRCSSSSSTGTSCTPRLVPGHRMWADKNGRHILGLIEDYNALRKQISEGQKLVSEMETLLREITGMKNLEPGVKVPDQESLNNFSANIHTVQQNLEEAARLLKLLWRVSLPMKVVHSTAHCSQDEGMKAEILRLHKKLSEQEKKLHSTVKRLHSTNQLKENMEKVIIDQLALTHDVLKKARGNLEVSKICLAQYYVPQGT
uniref:CDK5 regulatory subunit-associated protein 2 n=1 Tax=Chelonoidis abingdonii TaxID=106734 RepID=A0A8C0IX18_CHEAB